MPPPNWTARCRRPLYQAAAQVLAYVFRLKGSDGWGMRSAGELPDDLGVPELDPPITHPTTRVVPGEGHRMKTRS